MPRTPLVVGLLSAAIAAALTLGHASAIGEPVEGPRRGMPYAAVYDNPTDPLQALLNLGDGQAFAALAIDPTMSHPEVFREGLAEAAYRYQRPAYSYAAWAVALGDPDDVPAAIFALGIISVGAAGALVASLARRAGRNPLLGLAVLALPGVQSTLLWGGPDPAAAALAVAGLAWWTDGRRRTAAGAWIVGALLRETILLVPAALALRALWRRDVRGAFATGGAPLAVWMGWVTLVHARVGEWPWAGGDGRMSLPLVGLGQRLDGWGGFDAGMFALIVACSALAMVRGSSEQRWVAGAFVALAVTMGPLVWGRWHDFGRPLLPLCLLGLSLAGKPGSPPPDEPGQVGPKPASLSAAAG